MKSKQELKLLFVNPCLRPGGYTKNPPVGLASVMTYFHENDYQFTLLDIDINEFDDDYVENYDGKFKHTLYQKPPEEGGGFRDSADAVVARAVGPLAVLLAEDVLGLMLLLSVSVAEQRWQVGNTVDPGRRVNSGQLTGGRQEVPVGGDQIGAAASGDSARPVGDGRHTDATLGQIALVAGQRPVRIEEVGLVPTLLVRPVVRGKDHQRVRVDT